MCYCFQYLLEIELIVRLLFILFPGVNTFKGIKYHPRRLEQLIGEKIENTSVLDYIRKIESFKSPRAVAYLQGAQPHTNQILLDFMGKFENIGKYKVNSLRSKWLVPHTGNRGSVTKRSLQCVIVPSMPDPLI